MSPTYNIEAGTVIGETRNEIYNMYGENAYNTALYGWHHEHINETTTKAYNLVNTETGVKFLIATIIYPIIDFSTKIQGLPPTIGPDLENPSEIHFEWKDTSIPFLPKYELDAQGIQYSL